MIITDELSLIHNTSQEMTKYQCIFCRKKRPESLKAIYCYRKIISYSDILNGFDFRKFIPHHFLQIPHVNVILHIKKIPVGNTEQLRKPE